MRQRLFQNLISNISQSQLLLLHRQIPNRQQVSKVYILRYEEIDLSCQPKGAFEDHIRNPYQQRSRHRCHHVPHTSGESLQARSRGIGQPFEVGRGRVSTCDKCQELRRNPSVTHMDVWSYDRTDHLKRSKRKDCMKGQQANHRMTSVMV